MLAIRCHFRGVRRVLYAKSEHLNMTGSIKDRMALHILRRAYAEGRIQADDTIVEATSGNTGISFSALGRALGHPVVIFMPDWMSRERMDLIGGFGATVIPISHEEGGFLGSVGRVEAIASERSRASSCPASLRTTQTSAPTKPPPAPKSGTSSGTLTHAARVRCGSGNWWNGYGSWQIPAKTGAGVRDSPARAN